MTRILHHESQAVWRKNSYLFLAFSYVAGILSGVWLYFADGDIFVSLMRSAAYSAVSIVGLFLVTTLPFLVSAFAVYISKPWLLLFVCYGKAVLFSAASFAAMHAFGSAGWLIRSFLCFSACADMPVLYFFWLRHISGIRKFSFSETFLFFSLSILIGSFDYCVVSPFLADLIS